MRSWIESPNTTPHVERKARSTSSWGRELKGYATPVAEKVVRVDLFVRSWIERWRVYPAARGAEVDLFVRSWIERWNCKSWKTLWRCRPLREVVNWKNYKRLNKTPSKTSTSSWGRELKGLCHGAGHCKPDVDLFVRSWIERLTEMQRTTTLLSRPLREVVNWKA